MSEALIYEYYRHFNDGRITEAAALIAGDAVLELTPGQSDTGPAGYARFVQWWTAAFPDAKLRVQRIVARGETLSEVDLLATGTHRGILDFGAYRFRPSGVQAALHVRELLDIKDEKITAAVLSVDLNDLVAQFSHIDFDELSKRLRRICSLASELALATGDDRRRREIVSRLGPELDAARRAVRPHFSR